MCESCIALSAAEDQVFASAKHAVVRGAEWANHGLLAGHDPVYVWRMMSKAIVADTECTREDFAVLLAAAYVRYAQEGDR
jgi:hypothetical protein